MGRQPLPCTARCVYGVMTFYQSRPRYRCAPSPPLDPGTEVRRSRLTLDVEAALHGHAEDVHSQVGRRRDEVQGRGVVLATARGRREGRGFRPQAFEGRLFVC